MVLTTEDLEFIAVNSEEIKQMANEQWSGTMPMDKRERYEHISLKLGRRFNICWTCGGSIKRIGKQLQEWL